MFGACTKTTSGSGESCLVGPPKSATEPSPRRSEAQRRPTEAQDVLVNLPMSIKLPPLMQLGPHVHLGGSVKVRISEIPRVRTTPTTERFRSPHMSSSDIGWRIRYGIVRLLFKHHGPTNWAPRDSRQINPRVGTNRSTDAQLQPTKACPAKVEDGPVAPCKPVASLAARSTKREARWATAWKIFREVAGRHRLAFGASEPPASRV